MLSDLEDRKAGQPGLQKEILSDTLPPPRTPGNNRPMQIGAAILLILLAATAGWWYLNHNNQSAQIETLPSSSPTRAAPSAASLNPMKEDTPKSTNENQIAATASITQHPQLQNIRYQQLAGIERIIL